MSEKLLKKPEVSETIPTAEHEKLRAHANAEKHHVKNNSREKAQQAREAIAHETEAQQNPLERLSVSEKASQAAPNLSVNRELKQITLRRELKNIQRKLPAPQKALSKVIHQPVVRATSEFAGKTVTRPSGLLGGGLVALIGTSTYLYLARHMGFEYNYGVFLALFVGGFIVGIGLEFLVNLATNPRRKLRD